MAGQAKFCGQCGQPLREGSRFCTSCGATVSADPPPSASANETPTLVLPPDERDRAWAAPAARAADPASERPTERMAPADATERIPPPIPAAPPLGPTPVPAGAAPPPRRNSLLRWGVPVALVVILLGAVGAFVLLRDSDDDDEQAAQQPTPTPALTAVATASPTPAPASPTARPSATASPAASGSPTRTATPSGTGTATRPSPSASPAGTGTAARPSPSASATATRPAGASPTPAASGAPAATRTGGPITVTMARDVTENYEPVGATAAFPQSTPVIYAAFKSANAGAGARLKSVWTVVSAGSITNEVIDEATLTLPQGTENGAFNLKPARLPWPVGQYKVDFYVNDRLVLTMPFTVVPDLQ